MSASVSTLAHMTGLSEAELARRAQDLVATGKIKGLSALDAALLAASTGMGGTADPFSAGAAQSQKPHMLEEPAQSLSRANDQGFAMPPSVATPSLSSPSSPAALDKAAATGSQKIKGFGLLDGLERMELAVRDLITNANKAGGESKNILFEQIKMQMQRISEIFQALSNVLSTSNDQAKSAINNIRA